MIKFRIWSNKLEKYIKNNEISSLLLMANKENDISFYYGGNKYIKLEQFTGVQDNKGKDIFVGDILRLKDESGKIGKVIVGFEDGAFIVFRGIAFHNISFYNTNELEIIGNINENKELLK